jgi:hypothetical protein
LGVQLFEHVNPHWALGALPEHTSGDVHGALVDDT